MKRLVCMVVMVSVFLPLGLFAQEVEFGPYFQFVNSDDLDSGIGPGLKCSAELVPPLSLDLRIGWLAYNDVDMDVIPVEILGIIDFPLDVEDVWHPYVGLGLGYYSMDANRGKADDDVGWMIMAGIEYDYGEDFSFFGEIRYLDLESDVNEEFQMIERTSSDIDVGGIGFNVGVLYVW